MSPIYPQIEAVFRVWRLTLYNSNVKMLIPMDISGTVLEETAKILVVDDEKVIRDILQDFLGAEGYDVTAAGGEEALNLLDEKTFDVLLTDLKMPGMSGMELLENIKSRGIRIIIIIMTGYGTVESAVESIKKGAFDYIQKPFKMRDVDTIVKRGVRQHRLEQENIQLKEIMNLYKISEAVNSTLSLDEILEIILDTVVEEIDADAVTIHELTEDNKWNVMARRAEEETLDGEITDPLGTIKAEDIIAHLEEDSYLLLTGEETEPFFEKMPEVGEIESFLAVPLRIKASVTGMVCAYSFDSRKKFLKGHSFVMGVLAGRASLAIENARLYERLKKVFQETIQTLVIALEAKDPYTSGHTKRVTDYSAMIAKGLKLSPEETELVTRAALLHDIGKIGIRLNYLNKTGELTPEEHEIFKQHTTQGRAILEAAHFLRDLVPIVESHHERIDGMGYPMGLKGDDIPLGGRIIAVADSFDAMTSDRPYRRSLSRKKAIEELKKNSGTQFDSKIVKVFIEQLKKSG